MLDDHKLFVRHGRGTVTCNVIHILRQSVSTLQYLSHPMVRHESHDRLFGLALFRHSLRGGRRLFVDVYNYLLTQVDMDQQDTSTPQATIPSARNPTGKNQYSHCRRYIR
jgi:hypothetical protein